MNVLVTGANGFIGQNLTIRLRERTDINVLTFGRGQSLNELREILRKTDVVVHLAGENRPTDFRAFDEVNRGLTQSLCEEVVALGKTCPILFTSSTQAELDNHYGRSKLAAEQVLVNLATKNYNPVAIYRLPGVFGKWCKPNYNSVVGTFCHNKAHDMPVHINDPSTILRLVYVDDVISAFIRQINSVWTGVVQSNIDPEYQISLGDLANQIEAFKNCRTTLISESVGIGFTRALYATYLSYIPVDKFVYSVPAHSDTRGMFVEMLKTRDSGQFSFFTAHPGVTRGGHYHHTKCEKFLVIKGHARFGFRNMRTNDVHYIDTDGSKPQVVETVPGWTHDITNIGYDELVVMLWANENFDCAYPDTIVSKV